LLAFSLATLGCMDAKADKGSAADSVAAMPKSDRMSLADFKKLNAAGGVVVIDVRSHDAYQGGHIPGALSMPENSLNAAVGEKLKAMGKPVATYCA